MKIENVPDLSEWLINKLPTLCAADPDPLSKYILALITKATSETKLKKICNDALQVFLHEKTDGFVTSLFDCIKNKTYMPDLIKTKEEVEPTPKQLPSPVTSINKQSKSGESSDSELWHNRSPNQHISKRHRDHSEYKSDISKKRKRYECDHDNERRKFSDKHQRYGRNHDRKDRHRKDEYDPLKYGMVKTSCADFVEKGVCLKGDTCEFDHGNQIMRSDINCIYSGVNISQADNSNWQNMSLAQRTKVQNIYPLKTIDSNKLQSDMNNKRQKRTSFYDPSHPEINANTDISANSNDSTAPVYVPSEVVAVKESSWWKEVDSNEKDIEEGLNLKTVVGNHRNDDNNNRRSRYQNNDNKKRYSTGTCLLLTHIPTEYNNEEKLENHFEQFGLVTNIWTTFQGEPHNALIEFENHEQAKTAFRSPAPIFDNRFIRTSLFNKPKDLQNSKFCRDTNKFTNGDYTKNNNCNINEVIPKSETNSSNKWNRERYISNSSDGNNTDCDKVQKKFQNTDTLFPNPNELKIDRRKNNNENDTASKSDELKLRKIEAKLDREEKLKLINERKEMMNRIARVENSVDDCKKRLRLLLEEQKKPDCDQDLIKRQLLETYNYFKDLREMLESLKKKVNVNSSTTEVEKLTMKIQEAQHKLSELETDSEEHRKQLKYITALKREQVKMQTISKQHTKQPIKIPKRMDMKLDNRPKILYLTEVSDDVEIIKEKFKNFQMMHIEVCEENGKYIKIEFMSRKEADRALKESLNFLNSNGVSVSFEKPVQVCDPLDFQTKPESNIQRGTPSRTIDGCGSTDDEDESNKIN